MSYQMGLLVTASINSKIVVWSMRDVCSIGLFQIFSALYGLWCRWVGHYFTQDRLLTFIFLLRPAAVFTLSRARSTQKSISIPVWRSFYGHECSCHILVIVLSIQLLSSLLLLVEKLEKRMNISTKLWTLHSYNSDLKTTQIKLNYQF